MANPVMDGRYIEVGEYGREYFVQKHAADKLFLEFDLAKWLAAGPVPNVAALTVVNGAWTDAGANAPVLTAGTHTSSRVKFALTAGNTSWNAGAGGGYVANRGAITLTVTAPTTGEKKVITLIVQILA